MHQIIHEKPSKIYNHTLHIHIISQYIPLIKNLQTTCFYLVFILVEHTFHQLFFFTRYPLRHDSEIDFTLISLLKNNVSQLITVKAFLKKFSTKV